jgi:hypothetical protein
VPAKARARGAAAGVVAEVDLRRKNPRRRGKVLRALREVMMARLQARLCQRMIILSSNSAVLRICIDLSSARGVQLKSIRSPGPIGAAIVVLSLPFVVIFLHRICPPAECDHQAQAQSSGKCAKNATAATTCHTESRAQYAAENCVDKCIRGLDFSRILQADLFDGLSNLISWEACLLYAGYPAFLPSAPCCLQRRD